MATIAGKDGVVKVATATVAEVTSFTLNINAGTVEDTVMGDSWRTFIVATNVSKGLKSWDGTVECRYDSADTTGQVALAEGAQVTLSLLPDGTAGKTGTAIITSISAANSFDDQTVSRTFTFVGNGALTNVPA